MSRQREFRILIAADYSIFRDAVRKLLETEDGFSVAGEATNAEDVLKLVKELRPDVLLLDISMPQLTASKVLQRLSALPNTGPPCRAILLASSIERSEVVDALLLGVRGIVSKQSASPMLFKAIRCVAGGEIWVARNTVSDLVGLLRGSLLPGAGGSCRFGLTRRELELVAAVAEGRLNKDIAQIFQISVNTVKYHLTRIFDKLGVSNRVELVMFAMNHRLISQLVADMDTRDRRSA